MSVDMNRPGLEKRLISFILATLIISVLLLLPILGCLAGVWYGIAWHEGTIIAWKPLAPLPQKATEILDAGTDLSNYSWFVYVKTTDQKIYFCSPDSCWIEKIIEPEALLPEEPCDPPVYFTVPSPPGKVVDSIETQACHPEAVHQANFVVLEDGSIWRWQHFTTGLSLLEQLFISTVCGSASGMLGSTMTGVFILLRKKHKKNHNYEEIQIQEHS